LALLRRCGRSEEHHIDSLPFPNPGLFRRFEYSRKTGLPAAPISNPGLDMVMAFSQCYTISTAARITTLATQADGTASYTPDFLSELGEPIAEAWNDYREAALHFVRIMFAVDEAGVADISL
jgi:hypothetical protein